MLLASILIMIKIGLKFFINFQQGNTPFNLAISKQNSTILRMLEEHSGGNYPFPVLEKLEREEGMDEKSSKSGNLIHSKHLSNSAESLDKRAGNLAPSKYYHTDQLPWR